MQKILIYIEAIFTYFITNLQNLTTLLDPLSWNFGPDVAWEVFYKRWVAFFEKQFFGHFLQKMRNFWTFVHKLAWLEALIFKLQNYKKSPHNVCGHHCQDGLRTFRFSIFTRVLKLCRAVKINLKKKPWFFNKICLVFHTLPSLKHHNFNTELDIYILYNDFESFKAIGGSGSKVMLFCFERSSWGGTNTFYRMSKLIFVQKLSHF